MSIGDYNPCWGNQPLESFHAELARDPRVRAALEKAFGARATAILAKLKAEEELEGDELGAADTILDLVRNESEIADNLECQGGYGAFPVTVLRFGPVFWIQAPEFDDIGFFESLKEAMEVAESEFAEFIAGQEDEDPEDEEVEDEDVDD